MNVSHNRSDFCHTISGSLLSLLGLLSFFGDFVYHFQSLLEMSLGCGSLGFLQHLLEHLAGGKGRVLGKHDSDRSRGRVARSERIVLGGAMEGTGGVSCHGGVDSVGSEHMSDLSHDVVVSSDHGSARSEESLMHKSVPVHDRVQFVDLSVGSHGGVSDDAVELVHKSVVSNEGVHLIDLHL
jgi:hypothetical protein